MVAESLFGGFVLRVEFPKILRFVAQIVAEPIHCRRASAGIETCACHEVKTAFVGFVFDGHADIFRNRIVNHCGKFAPVDVRTAAVHVDIHADHHCAELLSDGLRITFRRMLFKPVNHFVSEYGGKLMFVEVEPAHKPAIDADVIHRVTGGVELFAVVEAPHERQGIDAQFILPVVDEPRHDGIDDFNVAIVLVDAVFFDVLSTNFHLRVNVVAEREHLTER